LRTDGNWNPRKTTMVTNGSWFHEPEGKKNKKKEEQ